MKMKLDKEADALDIRFDEAKIAESEEVSDGIILGFEARGRIIGLGMLDVRRWFPNTDFSRVQVELA